GRKSLPACRRLCRHGEPARRRSGSGVSGRKIIRRSLGSAPECPFTACEHQHFGPGEVLRDADLGLFRHDLTATSEDETGNLREFSDGAESPLLRIAETNAM